MDVALIRETMAWSLLHALWQVTVLAALLTGASHLTRSPGLRHHLALSVLVVALTTPVATGMWLGWRARDHSTVQVAGQPVLEGSVAAEMAAGLVPLGSLLLPWLPLLWIAGVLVLGIRCVGGWRATARLLDGAMAAPPQWQARVEDLRRRMRIRAHVQLAFAASVAVPLVVGLRRPTILLPAASANVYPPEELELLLAHELAHVRRRDAAVNLVQIAAEIMLFFHPAVRWISARIRAEREACCDDVVVFGISDRRTYVRALARAEMLRGEARAVALAATGDGALCRIRRLLDAEAGSPARATRVARAAVPLISALLLSSAGAATLPLSAGSLAAARSVPLIEVHATDPAGEFGVSISRGRVVAATLDGVPLRNDRIHQARDSVYFLGPGGAPLFGVKLMADGIRWEPRRPAALPSHPIP